MQINKRFYIVTLLLCLGISTQTIAQQQDKVSATVDLDPVVITGTSTSQRLHKTIAPVKVISAQEIKHSGFSDTQETLKALIPGLSFSPNAMGAYLTMNGLSNKYVLVLVNGRRVNGGLSGNIDLQRINTASIQRIEVLNGAASSLYGSDAIGGVINIITENSDKKFNLQGNIQYDTYGNLTNKGDMKLKIGKFESYTHAQNTKNVGWQQSELSYTDPETLETEPTLRQTGKAFASKVLNQKFTYKPNDKLSIYADGQYYTYKTDRPVYTKETDGGWRYNLDKKAYNIGAGAVYNMNEKASFSIDAFADQYVQDKNYLVKYKDFKVNDKLRYKEQAMYNLRAKGVLQLTDRSQTVFGIDHRINAEKRPSALLDKSLYNVALFAQHEQQITAKLKAIGGLSFDYYETGKWHLSPKLALMYAWEHLNIRANYANGFRAASLKEMYYFYATRRSLTLGDANLKPEESHYVSLNAEYHREHFSLSVTPFMNHISDMINVQTTPFADLDSTYAAQLKAEAAAQFDLTAAELKKIKNLREYRNINKARVRGVEANMQAHLGKATHLYANYAYTVAEGLSEDDTWEPLDRSIRHTLTYGANYARNIGKHFHFNINLNARTQSKRYYPGDAYGDAPEYTVVNFMSTHTIKTNDNFVLSLSLGINNILNKIDDRPYGVNYGLYSPGRSFVFGLTTRI